MTKLRVGVIFGGRSGEHEVSIVSAASIFKHLDRERYEPVPIRIEKDGRWVLGTAVPTAQSAAAVIEERRATSLESASSTALRTAREAAVEPTTALRTTHVDVVFPVLHGTFGEDGTVQGLLELANVPYVGAGVLGSAVGMDKAVMKKLFAAEGLPIVPYIAALRPEWDRDARGLTARVARELKYPVFVKPANLGSSVGISKAKSDAELAAAMELALQFDRKVVVEAAVPKAREIECAVLGNDDPEASVPGEVVPSREFYDYQAKYLDEGSKILIPAPISKEQADEVRRLSILAFRALDGAGMSRVDFLMSGDTGELFLNEVNTIPGFTTISMYPKMWDASGLAYPALLERLITLALERHAERRQLRTSI
ncbi:MAG TPA: D-alanine--D-alanine ligase family protein [Vicinamibacterales bacterium]|nr:D-alanine--D-alanine ligase family protein [Vicinamibacterales bacterium]